MRWYVYVAHFFGGAFFVNALPHFINGLSGRPFPTRLLRHRVRASRVRWLMSSGPLSI